MTVLSTPAPVWTSRRNDIVTWIRRLGDRPSDAVTKAVIVLTGLLILVCVGVLKPHIEVARLFWATSVGRVMAVVGVSYSLAVTFWSFWRLYLAIRYRPVPNVPRESLPAITVVVPAFNEGPLVGQTLRRIAQADYPSDRLQIIAVDDGSDDDTWSHIRTAAQEIGSKLTAVKCPTNRGKRWALWEGFRRGNGEVFVTVDSDSLIAPDALKALVSPMVRHGDIGAVAGSVRVLNHRDGWIPRMLCVRYVMTFDYKRAAQSMMGGGAVLCCAGALAAYRRSAVMPVLEKWLHQSFRGAPARAGEDHAMTNFILGQGLRVCYQRTARVQTKSPTTYPGLCRMFLRWGRSNIRETVHTGRFAFTAFRPAGRAAIRFNYIMGAVGLVLPYPFIFLGIILALYSPAVFGIKFLGACVTGSLFAMIFYGAKERSSEAVFALPYALFSSTFLAWIQPYALLTCRRSVWLTRVSRTAAEKANRGPTWWRVLAKAAA